MRRERVNKRRTAVVDGMAGRALSGANSRRIALISRHGNNEDLFGGGAPSPKSGKGAAAPGARPAKSAGPVEYNADSIEVLEGLEPVRRRPGMYIGGTDEAAMHHSSRGARQFHGRAVAGHATFISVSLEPDGWLTVIDNGRGIPSACTPRSRARPLWKS